MDEMPVHTSGGEVHAHPRHTGQRWFDVTMAVAAIFISSVSLYVAVEHGRTERELVAASTWPFPESTETDDYGADHSLMFGLSNAGTGPAKIYTYEVNYQGKPMRSPKQLLQVCCGFPKDETAYRRLLPRGTLAVSSIDYGVLRPGETVAVFALRRTTTLAPYLDRLETALHDLTFHTCYCSVLNECWSNDLQHFQAEKVQACPASEHPYDVADK